MTEAKQCEQLALVSARTLRTSRTMHSGTVQYAAALRRSAQARTIIVIYSDIVSALSSNRTMFDELYHRTMKFVLFCLSQHNCIVRNSLFFL